VGRRGALALISGLLLPPASVATAQDRPVDVVFLIDTTADMAGAISNVSSSLGNFVVPYVADAYPLGASGVAVFRDFPILPYGYPGPTSPDFPYRRIRALTTDVDAVQVAFGFVFAPATAGGDAEDSGHEALYQVATGAGVAWPGGSLAPSDLGFRPGARRVVVLVTGAAFHETYAGFTAHSSSEALAALANAGVKVVGLSIATGPGGHVARPGLEAYARATGARVPAAQLPADGQCPLAIGGATRPPEPDGTCLLVFEVGSNGSGIYAATMYAMNLLLQDMVFQDGFNAGP
jgi:hypothetical protein